LPERVVLFIGWTAKDMKVELGPVKGARPNDRFHVIDSQFALEVN
jgi:hypothetical protein